MSDHIPSIPKANHTGQAPELQSVAVVSDGRSLKFVLFAGTTYEEKGGWRDHRGTFGSLDEAISHAESLAGKEGHQFSSGWWHVVDFDSGLYVAMGGYDYEGYFKGDIVFSHNEDSYVEEVNKRTASGDHSLP